MAGAFTWQFDPNHQLFAYGTYVRNDFTFAIGPSRVTLGQTFQQARPVTLPPTSAFYPHAFAQFFKIVNGYDPTYTDPRGRLYWAGIRYAFK